MTRDVVHVVAAALVDADRRVLLSKRHADSHQGGLWEFPGGKLETGEAPAAGLSRELEEELGVRPTAFRRLIKVSHQYADRHVLLDVYRVSGWSGVPRGMEGQPLAWVEMDALREYPMPAADLPVVTALQLPAEYLISPPAVDSDRRFLERLERALQGGIRLFQYRVFDLQPERKRRLAMAALSLCEQYAAEMLLNSDQRLLQDLPAAGLHLTRRQLRDPGKLPDLSGRRLAASCHDLGELQLAADLGVDFATLSPVLPTASHPDAQPLGWESFADIVSRVALPVYALGGLDRACLSRAWEVGAQGIAGIRGIWPGQE